MQSEPYHFERATLEQLETAFPGRLRLDAPLARYTAARVGGAADALLEVRSAEELAQAVRLLWEAQVPWVLLGGGSNVLVSDAGVRGVVILNRARRIRFGKGDQTPQVWAESGANLGVIARQAARRGLTGLEWAAGIPGSLGGAVYGNAGAHGSDMGDNLLVADILHRLTPEGIAVRETWTVEQLDYSYRISALKRHPGKAVVLAASLRLEKSMPEAVRARMEELSAYRHRTQPPGASMGSMFKNPPGDYAGRLIEAAGLKGKRIGGAEISSLHANFFVNRGGATAQEIDTLIQEARRAVQAKFGVELELEIEKIGEWTKTV